MNTEFRPRHPLLVLVWSFGILVAMNLHVYVGTAVGALVSGQSFKSIISGEAKGLDVSFTQGLVAAFIGLPLAYLVIRFLWRRSFDWMRLRFNGRQALTGLVLGLVSPLVVLAVTSAFVEVHVTASPSRLNSSEIAMIIVSTLCWMSFVAFSEETVFRGMVVREWGARWGWIIGTVLGGLFFGAMHLKGLGGSPVLSVILVLVAGVAVTTMFVALYVRGRSLWLPIGFHVGWNFCLQAFLGVTISGKEPEYALFNHSVSGPGWLTGGEFGIEASLIATAFYLILALAVLGLRRHSPLLSSKPETPAAADLRLTHSGCR